MGNTFWYLVYLRSKVTILTGKKAPPPHPAILTDNKAPPTPYRKPGGGVRVSSIFHPIFKAEFSQIWLIWLFFKLTRRVQILNIFEFGVHPPWYGLNFAAVEIFKCVIRSNKKNVKNNFEKWEKKFVFKVFKVQLRKRSIVDASKHKVVSVILLTR